MKAHNVIILLFTLFTSFATHAASCEKVDEISRCTNSETKTFGDFSFTPSYKNIYALKLLNLAESCDDTKLITGKQLPKNSFFKQTLDRDGQNSKEMLVHVYELNEQSSAAETEKAFFNSAFKICLAGNNKVPRSNYKRIGGISTGLLVVPFKFRDGDIFSDSTIGQYISYKWEVIEILATAGLSQISVSEVGSEEVESKTGITVAFGVNFEIAKDWDIALLLGRDHLSGSTGDDWQYQDETWISFAIGFNFTR